MAVAVALVTKDATRDAVVGRRRRWRGVVSGGCGALCFVKTALLLRVKEWRLAALRTTTTRRRDDEVADEVEEVAREMR